MWDILVYNKVLSLNADVPVSEQLIGDGRVMAHRTARLWPLHDRTISVLCLSHRTDGCRIIAVILGKD